MFGITPDLVLAAVLLTLFAGFVKGAVGFAQPMIMISGLATFLPPQTAIAAMIAAMVVSNVWQGLRTGPAAARAVVSEYRVYLGAMAVCILIAAQVVLLLPADVLLLVLGVPITLFCLLQLVGVSLRLDPGNRWAEAGFGMLSGLIGGLAGVWGPLTVIYLTAIDTPKAKSMLVQGVIYFAGAVVLMLAHLRSGLLNAETLPLSLLLVLPSLTGMAIGFAVNDRLDQKRFRQATLVVLAIASLNLVRRGLM